MSSKTYEIRRRLADDDSHPVLAEVVVTVYVAPPAEVKRPCRECGGLQAHAPACPLAGPRRSISPDQFFVETKSGTSYQLTPGWSQKVWNHSPTGFNYGYGGSGPAQLALAILLDHLGDEDKAVGLHQLFKAKFIAPVDQAAPFTITSDQIDQFVADLREKAKAKSASVEQGWDPADEWPMR